MVIKNTIGKLFKGCILIIFFMLLYNTVHGQSPCENNEICVIQFNAGFNASNKVEWIAELSDCETVYIDIGVDGAAAGKYKIVVIPTILIFNGDEEVGRFQANIMMQMEATQKELQGKIDELIMEDF
jgi:hypothetical protein|tara:strand:+ start:436 stop:816 length:381 start_codon:yes stop_codon:yes gene_type:complete